MKRNPDLAVLAILLVLACIYRLYGLEIRPYDHDEAIHAWFSYIITKGLPYKFDPVYHGPLLYYSNAAIFKLFGATDFTARFLPALFSIGLIPLCYSMRRQLGSWGWAVSALFIIFSPTLEYYGRFLGHDDFVAFFTLATIALTLSFIRRPRPLPVYLLFVVLGLFICTKACFYIHVGLFISFIVLVVVFDSFKPEYPREEIVRFLKEWLLRFRFHILAASSIFIIIYVLLYSSFLSNLHGVISGISSMLGYWYGQQMHPRLPGPFYYYVPRLIFHEPVIFLALPALIYYSAKKGGALDVFLAFYNLASFTVYSFAQEKVPWLLMHPLLPMTLLAGRFFQKLMDTRRLNEGLLIGVLVLLMAWSARESAYLCFVSPPSSPHLLKYMATAEGPKQTARLLENMDESEGQIFITGDATWVLTWYLRDKNVTYTLPKGWEKTAAAVVADKAVKASGTEFECKKRILRTWWLPDYKGLFLKDAWNYLLFHKTRQGIGKTWYCTCLKSKQREPTSLGLSTLY